MKWEIPKLWLNETVFIIGGGPSLIGQDMCLPPRDGRYGLEAYLHDQHVIGVNSAFYFGDWVDICFFGDAKWYWWHENELKKFEGVKVTCDIVVNGNDRSVRNEADIKFIERRFEGGGLSKNGKIKWNSSSGGCAIDLANRLGAERIVLLGYDMRNHGVNTEYAMLGCRNFMPHCQWTKTKPDPFKDQMKTFNKIKADADSFGIEILNATPNSAVTVFKKINLVDIF